MSFDTFRSTWGAVLLRCPLAGAPLARQWVSHAFRRLSERRLWSWLYKEGAFYFPAAYTTGTVAVALNTTTVTGTGTAWDLSMEGRQIRISANTPLYTIQSVDAVAQTLELDRNWLSTTVTAAAYSIYSAYPTVPSDFHSFITVVDMAQGWQLPWNIGQDELDRIDPWRTNSGVPWLLSFHDNYAGTTATVITPPLPRYEAWPHQLAARTLSFLYETRAVDLQDSGAALPRYIRGDILLEMALEECAQWPGPSTEKKNPYFQLGLADRHRTRAEQLIAEAQRQDEEVSMYNVRYQGWAQMPFSIDSMGDAWAQSHDVGAYY